jgi:hypothetical protein
MSSACSSSVHSLSDDVLNHSVAHLVCAAVSRNDDCIKARSIRLTLETEFGCNLKSKKNLIKRAIQAALGTGLRIEEPESAAESSSTSSMEPAHVEDELVYAYTRSTQTANSSQQSRRFNCSECEFRCSKKSLLWRHAHVHSGNRPFSCEVCEVRFSRRHSLNRHMLTHVGHSAMHIRVPIKVLKSAVARHVGAAIKARKEFTGCTIRKTLEVQFTCDLSDRKVLILREIQENLQKRFARSKKK